MTRIFQAVKMEEIELTGSIVHSGIVRPMNLGVISLGKLTESEHHDDKLDRTQMAAVVKRK